MWVKKRRTGTTPKQEQNIYASSQLTRTIYFPKQIQYGGNVDIGDESILIAMWVGIQKMYAFTLYSNNYFHH